MMYGIHPETAKQGMKWAVLAFFGALIIVMLLSGCGSKKGPSAVERTGDNGQVSVEIPAKRTFDRDNLPAGVDPKEVVSVIPVEIEVPDSSPTESQIAPNPGDPVPAAKPKKPKRVSGNLYVLKGGNVVADKPLDEVIGQPQTVERSWVWLWWTLGVIASLVALAWAVDKFIKPIAFIGRLLGR